MLTSNYDTVCESGYPKPLTNTTLADKNEIIRAVAADTSIEQQFFTTDFSESNMQLHVFADASTKAYGAVVFLSCSDQITFVMAKGCIAPLKPVTLPKLELMVTVIAARLARFVLNSLRIDVPTHKILPQFIKHWVSEISKLTPNVIWRYYPSAANPVDLLTRGTNSEQFITSSQYFLHNSVNM